MKEILKAYKFRLKPAKDHISLLNQHIGHCRFIHNNEVPLNEVPYYFLNENKKKYENEKKFIFYNETCKLLTILKKEEEYQWFKNIYSQSLQSSLKNLEESFKRFFKKITNFPVFHKKSWDGSFGIVHINRQIEQASLS